jgi:hypothetical protein
MFQTLDTVVGVIFIFLLFSLVVSAAQEVVAAWLRLRGRALETGLNAMLENLGGPKLVSDFWAHGFIATLQPSGKTPSYLPPANIAAALVHIADGNHPGQAVEMTTLKSVLASLGADTARGQANLATVLATLLEQTGTGATLATYQSSVENWVNASMERVSSMYQRRTRMVLFLIALIFAGMMNIDAVTIWQQVRKDKALRDGLLAQAQSFKLPAGQVAADPKMPAVQMNASGKELAAAMTNYQGRLDQFVSVGLPIGWTAEAAKGYADFWSGNLHVFGILLSAFAASLGAPFWFDLLQRFMNVRSVVKPAEPSAKPKVP